MTRLKTSKKRNKVKDSEDNRKFMMVLAIATVVLMVLMYFAFAR